MYFEFIIDSMWVKKCDSMISKNYMLLWQDRQNIVEWQMTNRDRERVK